MNCECIYHRYHVVHVCPCGALISHSQSAWDAHRLHQGEWVTLDSQKFEHGDTAADVKRKAQMPLDPDELEAYAVRITPHYDKA